VVVVKVLMEVVVVVVVYCKISSIQTRLQYPPDGYRISPKLTIKIHILF
jgi:hypothetical protein